MLRELWRHALYAPADPPAGAGAAGGAAGGQPGAGGNAGGGAGGASPGGAAGTPPPPANNTPGWMSQYSPESRTALLGRDYIKAPDDIVKHLVKLESEAGSERVLIPGDKATPEQRQAYWKAGGWPDKPEAYELPTENIDAAFVDWGRKTFHEEGLSATQAKNIATKWQGYVETWRKEADAAAQKALGEEDQKLRIEWRGDYTRNMDITNRVAEYMGFSKDGIAALAQVDGYTKVRQALLKAAGVFDGGAAAPAGGQAPFSVTTAEQADAELKRMASDPAISKRLREGDAELNERWTRLHEIKTGLRMPEQLRGGRR